MKLWVWSQEGRAMLRLPSKDDGLVVQLAVYYGDGTTRAVWQLSTGKILRWLDPASC